MSEVASQSEETQETEVNEESQALRESFGVATTEVETIDEVEETPAIEEPKPESKKRIVKFNKEDREIDESEVDELLQKGLVLDKERDRKTELEKHLDRVAKLAGFDNQADYIANLDKIEQDQQQQKEDEYTTLESELVQEF